MASYSRGIHLPRLVDIHILQILPSYFQFHKRNFPSEPELVQELAGATISMSEPTLALVLAGAGPDSSSEI